MIKSFQTKVNSEEYLTPREVFKFEIVASLCKSAGMTERETAIFLQTGRIIPPMPWELKAWRLYESTGQGLGSPMMYLGKKDIESSGSLCTNNMRKQAYFGECDGLWEGMLYWNCFPQWYSDIILSWKPKTH